MFLRKKFVGRTYYVHHDEVGVRSGSSNEAKGGIYHDVARKQREHVSQTGDKVGPNQRVESSFSVGQNAEDEAAHDRAHEEHGLPQSGLPVHIADPIQLYNIQHKLSYRRNNYKKVPR